MIPQRAGHNDIRRNNLELVLRHLATVGPDSRAGIAARAGLTRATVSRLVAEFRLRIRDTPHIWMESAGEQFFENSPFHAATEMLSQWLQL